MNANLTPRQMLKGMLQGTPPSRPLFLPIVFSLGAKVENLRLPAFLANATKITNALRQVCLHRTLRRRRLLFRSLPRAEALGATLHT